MTYENYFITSLVEGLDFSRAHRGQCDMSNAMLVNILCSTWTVIRFPWFISNVRVAASLISYDKEF